MNFSLAQHKRYDKFMGKTRRSMKGNPMSKTHQPIDEQQLEQRERECPAASGAAFSRAYEQALQNGLSVVVSENGKIVEIFPDGQRKFIKSITLPTPDKPGRKIRIS